MQEKKITKRRLRYIADKLDDYWFDHLHPNEILDITIALRDTHTDESVGPMHFIISRFGKPYGSEKNAKK